MAWESRGNSPARYYYRSYRTSDGKVARRYFGSGERAALAAAALAKVKAQQAADHQAVQDEQARLRVPDEATSELIDVAHLLMEASLLVSGYHRQNYGKWRKRRGKEEM